MHTFLRHLCYLLLIIGLYTPQYQVFATPQKNCGTLVWKGGAINDTQNWFNATNWSPTMVPDEFQDVVIDNSSPYTCIISNPKRARCRSLLLNSRSLVVASAQDSLEITGTLTFGGGILDMTNGGTLIIYKDWLDQWATNGFLVGTSEVIWRGTNKQLLSSGNKIIFHDFKVECTNIELQTSIEITGKLSLKKGYITTTNKPNKRFLLAMGTAASLGETGFEGTGGSTQSFVNGPMEWKCQNIEIHYFPIGNGNDYAPIAISPQDNSPKIYRTEYYPQGFGAYNIDPSDTLFMSRICANEYWTIVPLSLNGTSITNDDAKVRLHWRYKTGLPYVGDRADIFVARYASDSWNTEGFNPFLEDKGSQWGVVESDIFISAFGSFTFGSKSGLIPVNFIDFEGSVTETFEIGLKWKMGEYGKTKQFMVERSIDEVTFTTIGVLDSSLLVNVNSIYDFLDKFPVEGYNYYRIRQVGTNGAYNYSQTIAIFLELGGFPQISALFPNPVRDVLNINMEYYVPEDGSVTAEIYDDKCVLISDLENISNGGNKIMSLDISRLPPGIYLCVLRFRGAMEGVKFLKI